MNQQRKAGIGYVTVNTVNGFTNSKWSGAFHGVTAKADQPRDQVAFSQGN